MSSSPENWDYLNSAWRYALVLTGNREGAGKVFRESVDEVVRHPHPGDHERTKRLLFTVLRRRALKHPASCELTGPAAVLHRQPEPDRSALTLLSLSAFDAEGLHRVLDLDVAAVAAAVDRARGAVQGQLSERP